MRINHGAFRRLAGIAAVGLLLTSCGTADEPSSASRTSPATTPTASPDAPAKAQPSPTPSPVVTTKTVTKTKKIPFRTVEQEDPDLEIGTTAVIKEGRAGTRTFTYEITLTDGVQTSRVLVKKEVTKKAINEVVAVGTYQPPEPEPEPQGNCDSNYSGCVPIDSDVDCEGGSGDGPSYASGPVEVVGSDIYGLDSDSDGVACE